MRDHIQGMLAELLFDLDELGMPEVDDQKPTKFVFSSSMAAGSIHHEITRNFKPI
jgi:hypothetical protein